MSGRLLIFLAGNTLFGSGLFFHSFLYNFYLEALGLPPQTMGHAAALLTAGGLVALIPAGRLVDVTRPDRVLVGASILGAAGLIAGALATAPAAILVAAFVVGAGTGAWRVASAPILMELTSEGNRSRVFSWNVGLLVTSGAAWIAAAGTLPSRLGAALDLDRLPSLRAAMLVGAGGTALSFLCFALLGVGWNRRAPEPRAAVRPIGRGPAGFLTDWRAPLGLALVVALWMTGPALVAPFFNLFFSRVHGLSVERVGGVLAVAQLVAGAAVFAGGELAARVGPRRALACWVFGFAPLLWALAVAPAGAAVAIFLALGIVSPASNALIDQLVMEQATPDRRGVLSSWRNAATDASGAAGASLGGAVLGAWSFPVLFGWAAVVGLAGGAALLWRLRGNVPQATG